MTEPGPTHPATSTTLIGALVAERYLISHIVGRGGMGTVYRCEDQRLHGRPCALKVVSGQSDPKELERFEREIHTVSQLRSAHTVQVFDCGQLPDGRPYIVMEMLEGQGLDAALRGGALSPERAALIAEQILTALVEAHALDIVHRDLKPANIYLVNEGDAEIAKVLDFGIAKQTDASAPDLTHKDVAMGTPRYMAPEQFGQRQVSARSDLYSVGVVAFEMLTGRQPFHETDPVPDGLALMPPKARLAWMHLNREAPTVDGISAEMSHWLERLLHKDPADRFEDALSARESLRQTMELSWPSNSRSGMPSVLLKPSGPAPHRRHHLPILIGLIAGLAGLGLLLLLVEQPSTGDETLPTRSAQPATAPVIERCQHTVETVPPSARLTRSGVLLGVSPLIIERPCSESWAVEAHFDGYVSVAAELSGPSRDLLLALTAIPPPPDATPIDASPPDSTPSQAITRPKPARQRSQRPRREARPVESPPVEADEPAADGPLIF